MFVGCFFLTCVGGKETVKNEGCRTSPSRLSGLMSHSFALFLIVLANVSTSVFVEQGERNQGQNTLSQISVSFAR